MQVWNNCLQMIQGVINPTQYKTWFDPIKPVSLSGNVFTIEVPSDFFRDYLEEHYISFISKALRKEIGGDAKLMYKVRIVKDEVPVTIPSLETHAPVNKPVPVPHRDLNQIKNPFVIPGLQQLDIDPQLNPNYCFKNFIEGECNRLGRAAGLAIANSPGKNAFNPLFIYGASGLGKTHLSAAIANVVANKGFSVVYESAQQVYDTCNAVRFNRMDVAERDKYENSNLLIIDDLGVECGNEYVVASLTSIIDLRIVNGRPTIISSNLTPAAIKKTYGERLFSRLFGEYRVLQFVGKDIRMQKIKGEQ